MVATNSHRITSYCPAIQLLMSLVGSWLVFWNWTSTVVHIGCETKENLAHEINSRVLVIKNEFYFDSSSLIKVTIRYKEHRLSNSPMLVKKWFKYTLSCSDKCPLFQCISKNLNLELFTEQKQEPSNIQKKGKKHLHSKTNLNCIEVWTPWSEASHESPLFLHLGEVNFCEQCIPKLHLDLNYKICSRAFVTFYWCCPPLRSTIFPAEVHFDVVDECQWGSKRVAEG